MAAGDVDPLIKKVQAVQSSVPVIRTGTCLSAANRISGVVTVSLDNDPSQTPVSAISVAGLLQIGARVACIAYPTQGLLVIGQIGGVPNLQILEDRSFVNQVSYSSNVMTLGSPIVGFSFSAPTSGMIVLDVSTTIDVSTLGCRARLFAQVRTGPVVGSGTLFWDGDGDQGPLIILENQKTGGAAARGALSSGDSPVTGMTPNQIYNVSVGYRIETAATGSMAVNTRRVTGLLVA